MVGSGWLGRAAVLAGLTVVAAGCGNSTATATVNFTGPSGTLSVVVTANQSDLAQFEKGAQSQSAPGVSESTVDGDKHTGSLICQTDLTAPGASGTAHLAVYSDISGVPTSICSTIEQAVQSASPSP